MHKHHFILTSFVFAGISLCQLAPAFSHEITGAKCYVDTTKLFQVVIGDVNKTPNIQNTLDFHCTWPKGAVRANETVKYCFHIHGKDNGETKFDYRYADYTGPLEATKQGITRETDKQISFNFYSQGHLVGNRVQAWNIVGVANRVSDTKYKASAPLTVKFEGNTTAEKVPGYYSYNDPQTHVIMTAFRPAEIHDWDDVCRPDTLGTKPGDIWGNGEAKGKTQVDIRVETYCKISTSQHIKFRSVPMIKDTMQTEGIVKVDCSGGTGFGVAINKGLHSDKHGVRQMKGEVNGEFIPYIIDPESWQGIGTGTPEGAQKVITATIEKPVVQPSVDKYRDVLVATLTQFID